MTTKQNFYYWRLWSLVCHTNGWSQQDNERRHRLHVAVFGYDKSHFAFSNLEFDLIIRDFKLRADPDDLESMVFFENPNCEEKKRLLYRIEQLADKPYVRTLSEAVFKTIYYHDLDLSQLTWLRNKLTQRHRAKKKRADAARAAVPADAASGELVGAVDVGDSNNPF